MEDNVLLAFDAAEDFKKLDEYLESWRVKI
jgi:hypothetical protein